MGLSVGMADGMYKHVDVSISAAPAAPIAHVLDALVSIAVAAPRCTPLSQLFSAWCVVYDRVHWVQLCSLPGVMRMACTAVLVTAGVVGADVPFPVTALGCIGFNAAGFHLLVLDPFVPACFCRPLCAQLATLDSTLLALDKWTRR